MKLRDAALLIQVYSAIVDSPELGIRYGLMHNDKYVKSIDKAKQALANNQQSVDDYEPRSDLCSKCRDVAAPANLLKSHQMQPLCRTHLVQSANP